MTICVESKPTLSIQYAKIAFFFPVFFNKNWMQVYKHLLFGNTRQFEICLNGYFNQSLSKLAISVRLVVENLQIEDKKDKQDVHD